MNDWKAKVSESDRGIYVKFRQHCKSVQFVLHKSVTVMMLAAESSTPDLEEYADANGNMAEDRRAIPG
jgi:hypothetical protein